MLDFVIKNVNIIDGTGKPSFRADVGISGEKIALIAHEVAQECLSVINGEGLCLSPGFIDPHTHSDTSLIIDGRAESRVYQGVTTEVVGNCGSSPFPLLGQSMEEMKREARSMGVDTDIDWVDTAGYIEKLQKGGIAVNVAPLVGHNTVRGSVVGFDDVQPTPQEQERMEKLVEESMQEGAFGLSSGLYYPPGYYAKTSEVIGLARAAAKHGGIYASHIRSESDTLFEAVEEALEIGEKAGIRVEISHLKLEGYNNFEGADRLLNMIDDANARGLDVGADQYPYTASSTWLGSILPNWAQAGGGVAVGSRLKNPETRKELRQDYNDHRKEWQDRGGVNEWNQILVTEFTDRPDLVGKTVAQIADEWGKDGLETSFDLILAADGGPGCVFFDQLEDNVRFLMKHPLVVTGSDGASLSPRGILGQGKPHPRSYGTFARVLGHYVRELKINTLEEAVRKMTSATARHFNMTGRGEVREGAWADLVLFDSSTIIARAPFTDPHQFPDGISHVWVNGKLVIEQGKHTGNLPGKVLRRG